jgi:prophage tail gpP-like protein
MRGDLLTAERADRAKTFIMDSLKPQARKDGTVAYRTADGGLVLDRASHVQAATATAGAALVALSLAAERFEGQTLDVRGTEQFRRDVAKFASMHKIRVTFADPAMETARRAAEAIQEVKQSAIGPTASTPTKGGGRPNTKGSGIEL